MRFVSDVTFLLQLYDRHMYLRFCTNQTIHSGQSLLNYAAETIQFLQFEVNMTKKVDNFFTVIVITGDSSLLAVEPPLEHTALQHPLVVIHSKQQIYP